MMAYTNAENESRLHGEVVGMNDQSNLIPHLFRTEYSRIVAVLCRQIGIQQLDVAEDIASETFATALQTWPYKGVPVNATAWLYTVAKNKAKNHLKRARVFKQKVAANLPKDEAMPEIEIDLSPANIMDSQLQMLFAVCHPSLSRPAQVALALRVLCGFSVEEIADAFLSSTDTIAKRITRAKATLRNNVVPLQLPSPGQMEDRLQAVLTTLYLLFSEGYYSETNETVLRTELCYEAIRLTKQLNNYEATSLPPVKALLALLCFQASRFTARTANNSSIFYEDQDNTLWDQELVNEGILYLHQASGGENLSSYHIEAAIAYWYTVKNDPAKWHHILKLYNQLLHIKYSQAAALNRLFALAQVEGPSAAIEEAQKLQLPKNQYYYAFLGKLYIGIDALLAVKYLQKALTLAKTGTDQEAIRRHLQSL